MKLTVIVFSITLLILLGTSCRKGQAYVIPERGGVALTFDDYNIHNWHSYLYLFDSLNVKCTFYISNYNKLDDNQKKELHDIQNHGHEIAFHSTNHVNFVKKLQSYGFKRLLNEEVSDGLVLMNNDGFYPKIFAYPYGAHNLILDKALLYKFKSIRTLNGTHDLNNSLYPLSGNTVIRSLGIDESSKRDFSSIENLLSSARELNSCAVFLIHNIEVQNTKLQLPLWKLRSLIIKAKSLNLHFYTISEISR